MNEHVDYVAKHPSKANQFFWWCAGVDKKILMSCSYSDHVKYVGIGGVVVATAFMAALSMGFAMQTIFHEYYISIPIAIIWSLIVFNLDRFIVSSTGKGDGEATISLKELGNATPRLLMAILLGLTISAPLETVIFNSEIQREWTDTKVQLVKKSVYDIGEIYASRQTELEKNIEIKKKELAAAAKAVIDQQLVVTKERQSGTGVMWQKNLKTLEDFEGNAKLIQAQIDTLEANYKELGTMKPRAEDSAKAEIMKDTAGFLDKVMMLERLSSEGKKIPKIDPTTHKPKTLPNGTVEQIEIVSPAFWAVWLVRLLFMIIEIAPVLLKLMLVKSPYDYMTENVHQILEAKQGISLHHMTDEHSQVHKLKENYNPKRIIAIVEHQNAKEEENAKQAITVFAEKEKKAIQENPDAFIKNNNEGVEQANSAE
jgi:hypothetical protein